MAHKKAGGSSRNGRDTAGRRLGVKAFGGETVIAWKTSSSASAAPRSTRAPAWIRPRPHHLRGGERRRQLPPHPKGDKQTVSVIPAVAAE
jgi:hypothetical protein